MKKLTTKQVKDYMAWRTDQEMRHCPECIAMACNEAFILQRSYTIATYT